MTQTKCQNSLGATDSPMQNSDTIFSQCPIGCQSTLRNTNIHLPEGALQQCPECKQLLSSCTKTWFEQSMQEFNVAEPTEKNRARYHRRMGEILQRAKRALAYSVDQPKMLDVGCSSGALLRVAQECHFEPHGVEPATEAAKTAKQLGFDVFPGYIQDAPFPDQHFDIITLFEVIEHLIEPSAVLNEVYRLLKPGGVFLIGTGNARSWTVQIRRERWEYFDIRSHGGHISFFNPESLTKLGESCGFHVQKITTRRVNFSEKGEGTAISYALNRVARELLEIPARALNKGHDMLAIMDKPRQ